MAVRMPNTAMDGCSGFPPDHLTASISIIQLSAQKQNAAATPYWAAAAVFPQQKITESVLADPCVFTSFEQFS